MTYCEKMVALVRESGHGLNTSECSGRALQVGEEAGVGEVKEGQGYRRRLEAGKWRQGYEPRWRGRGRGARVRNSQYVGRQRGRGKRRARLRWARMR